MTTLKEEISKLEKNGLSADIEGKEEAPQVFVDIALSILNGAIVVKGQTNRTVKVIPCSVEIYYHEEAGTIKDPIVYHRNPDNDNHKNKFRITDEKDPAYRDLEYFDSGILHNHVSGIDITFENRNKRYRASALIRAFKIEITEGENKVSIPKVLEIADNAIENRSTYMYSALFSEFSIFDGGFSIKWEDNVNQYNESWIEKNVRINVAKYNDGKKVDWNHTDRIQLTENKKYVQDLRRWRFSIKS